MTDGRITFAGQPLLSLALGVIRFVRVGNPVRYLFRVPGAVALRRGLITLLAIAEKIHAIHRLGVDAPAEVHELMRADAVRFLADSPAITGVTLTVDGGQHLLALPRDVMYLTGDPPP